MSSPGSYFSGFAFLIVGILTSIIFTFIVGVTIDGTVSTLEGIPFLSQVPEYWGSASTNDIYFWKNLAYVWAISPAILGVIAVLLASIKRQRVERQQQTMYDRSVQFDQEL